MLYYLVLGLQAFCIFHLYRNRNQAYWYFVIIFIPVLGSLIYIVTQVLSSRDVSNFTEEVTNMINPTKKILDLEKELRLADTFQNRVNLGDAYFENKDYQNAISNYLIALDGNFSNDPYTINNLIQCYFYIDDPKKVIEYAERIQSSSEFKKSRFFYGLSLEKEGKLDEAESQLRLIDLNYSNYPERLELSKFLIRRKKSEDAKEILNQLMLESQNMTKQNKRLHRQTIYNAANTLNEIS
jgi:hypothetical protein